MKFGQIVRHKTRGIGVIVATGGPMVCFISKGCDIGGYGGQPKSDWVYEQDCAPLQISPQDGK